MRIITGISLLALIIARPASAEQVHEPTGGSGGTYFTARCDQGWYMTGIAIQGAEAVISVAPICEVVGTGASKSTLSYSEKRFGGSRGERIDITCGLRRSAMRGMVSASYRAYDVRSEIGIFCGTPDGNPETIDGEAPTSQWAGKREVKSGGMFGADDPYIGSYGSDFCAAGEVVVGLVGRSGQAIDALGIICDIAIPSEPAKPFSYTAESETKVGAGASLQSGAPAATSPSVLIGKGLQKGPQSVTQDKPKRPR